MSSIIFKRFKSKGPEFRGQKLASDKSRGTDKTLKRVFVFFSFCAQINLFHSHSHSHSHSHITVINVYS